MNGLPVVIAVFALAGAAFAWNFGSPPAKAVLWEIEQARVIEVEQISMTGAGRSFARVLLRSESGAEIRVTHHRLLG